MRLAMTCDIEDDVDLLFSSQRFVHTVPGRLTITIYTTMEKTSLHVDKTSGKMGLDNPGLTLGSKTSLSPPPPYSEEKSSKKDALSSVYVVSRSEKLSKEVYDPYEHRQVKHATTFYETLFHMLKASLGTGILAMPNAFHNAGYLVGTVGTLVIGFLCTYSIHILISAQYELCRRRKKPSMNYPETLEAALLEGPPMLRGLAPYMDFVGNLFLMLYQLGTCCIYYVFVASNIKAVADEYIVELDVRTYMVLLLVPFILINCVRNLKLLAPFSTLANVVTLFSFAIIGYYMFSDIPHLSERAPIANFKTMPLFFGTVLFAMESIGVILPLENEMANPKRFGNLFGVLNCAMLPITVLYTFVGFFGYLKYGLGAHGSITLNLPNDHLLAQLSKLMLAFAIFITHGLNGYVAFDIIWNQKLKKRVTTNPLVWEYVTRITFVLTSFIFAVAIPNLELFISLIGALCLSTMGLSFPAFVQMFTFWNYYDGTGKILFLLKNFIVVLIAALGFSIGVSTSLHEIYLKFFT